MIWIYAHVFSVPPEERKALIADLELLLTRYESGDLPRIGYWQPKGTRAPVWPGDAEAFELLHRHHRKDADGGMCSLHSTQGIRRTRSTKPSFDFAAYWRAMCDHRTTALWGKRSLEDVKGSIVDAFLTHHTCLLHAGRHNPAIVPPHFVDGWCPCYRDGGGPIRRRRVVAALAQRLSDLDTVVTFNWDVVLEQTLWSVAKWSPCAGYGVPVELHRLRVKELGRQARRAMGLSRVTVLKPHGSINWVRDWDSDRLGLTHLGLLFGMPIHRSYQSDHEALLERRWPSDVPASLIANLIADTSPEDPYSGPIILAPTYLKNYADRTLRAVWEQVDEAIESAAEITVVGYGLPPGDKSAQVRLCTALRQDRSCDKVSLIDPEFSVVGRWKEFLDTAQKHMVWHQATFEEWLGVPIARQRRGDT